MAASDPSNPLLMPEGLPDFSSIRPEHVTPAVTVTLAAQRDVLAHIEAADAHDFDWALSLEHVNTAVHRIWGPIVHLNAVTSSPALRDAYNTNLNAITEFWLGLGQNEKLYHGFEQLQNHAQPSSASQSKLLEHSLRDFRLAGVALEAAKRERFRAISQELATEQARFEQNLMDATDAYRRHFSDAASLTGLPDVFLERASKTAQAEGLDGYLLTLDPPTYSAVMAQVESAAVRAEFYEAWVTRASDRGPHAGQWNNDAVIAKILALRHESAQLLGYASYAELSLATKMAPSAAEVVDFLRDLSRKSRPMAERELHALEAHAGRKLDAWDIAFYSEQLKRKQFAFSAEDLRPYFPLPKVRAGLFEILATLLGIRARPIDWPGLWHPDVEAFEICDRSGQLIGAILTDLYARPNKRGGAWMDGAQSRAKIPGLEQAPIAYLVCNFNPPSDTQPALLTHDEVVTLFHEFGHALHHLLTEIDYPSLAGINGVPWDAVELPSQFLENYAWLDEALPKISAHFQTGKRLPDETLATLKASRQFMAGLAMLRQLEFALFDMRLHAEYDPTRGACVGELLAEVRDEVAVIAVPGYNRFAHSFAHIFGAGYAAGYYSYKWAEVLAADAFSAFDEQGGFDQPTADRFRRCILASGGTRDVLEAFTEFRGRAPSLEPLLRQAGIATWAHGV